MMPKKIVTTTLVEVWEEGDWSNNLTLTQLARFVIEARRAGFEDSDVIFVQGGTPLTHINLSKTHRDTDNDA